MSLQPRPLFHFTATENWLNDPNGMVFLDGEWHLFYQHNPFGNEWGHMSWGHAISRDLVHWEHLPVALPEQPEYMIYSGSAVVDWQNTSGFGEGALVAIYTAHHKDEETQHIAYSNDRGRTWHDYASNPVLATGMSDFRDPKVFWHAATQTWVMVVSLAHEHRVQFYGSHNLRAWTHLSDFGPAGSCGGAWECPDFFSLQVLDSRLRGNDNLGEKWILKIDDWQGINNASGAQYFVGEFDGTTFTCDDAPNVIRPIDFGMDFYAAQSWGDVPATDGRRMWLAWMSNWAYASKTPTTPWRSTMTLPREVTLRERDGEMVLAQQPARELQNLRHQHWHIEDASLSAAQAWLYQLGVAGTALEIDVTIDAADYALDVRVGAAERTTVGFDGEVLFVDRSESGHAQRHFSPRFDDRHRVPLTHAQAQRLHIFVDVCSVEVFADEGQVVISELIFPDDASTGVALRGEGRVKRMDVWRLQ